MHQDEIAFIKTAIAFIKRLCYNIIMSLHALDLQNRHQNINNYTAPIEPELAPTQVEQAPKGIIETIRHLAQIAFK